MKDYKKFLAESKKSMKEKHRDLLEKHIIKHSDLSDDALVSLVVLDNGESISEEKICKELDVFGFINEEGVTEQGKSFLSEKSTIERLKKIIES